MSFNRAATRVFSILLLAFGARLATGAPIQPPLELLHAPGNLLVAGSVLEVNPAGRIVFARGEVLAGKPRPSAQIDVSVPASVLATAKVGERYVFGYSMYRPDRRLGGMVANPEGPVLLVSLGMEPALFRDIPAVRALLKAGRSEHARESRRFYELVMQALAGDDPQLQYLAAGEIALDPELRERVQDKGRAQVERAARDPKTALPARALLLQTAANQPRYLGDWWQAEAVRVVTTTPVDGYSDAASDPSGLVLVSFDVLGQGAIRVPPDGLQRWLHGANPALAERASLLLRRDFPAAERPAIMNALADPQLPTQTRKFLDDHLRRLDRLDAAARARKDGSD
ncbi:MAG: hypothetical protein GXC76_07400 [Rhodanobacteraceae bacterium]|jgi:hypothetical protein|nr:hypothetical protein [Rhodanobacteraceae bacterium]